MNGTDCCWCGTGEGLCDVHMHALFAESEVLAATGQFLAPDDEKHAQPQTAPTETESEVQQHAAA